jgi:hypothetical protein
MPTPVPPVMTTLTFSAKEIDFMQTVLYEYQSSNEARNSRLEFGILENCLAVLESKARTFPIN